MGGVDKPLVALDGRPLVAHVLARIAPQVQGRVLISANRHLTAYAAFGHPVLTDAEPDFPGPLAGLLAGLAALPPDCDWLLCVSGDSPRLPLDLAARLHEGRSPEHTAAMALGRDGPARPMRVQPLASLVHRCHHGDLAAALQSGERRVQRWFERLPVSIVPFDRPEDASAFVNVNERSDLEPLAHPVAPAS